MNGHQAGKAEFSGPERNGSYSNTPRIATLLDAFGAFMRVIVFLRMKANVSKDDVRRNGKLASNHMAMRSEH